MAIMGLDIGGTKCAVIRADDSGTIEQVEGFPTTTADETLDRLLNTVEKLQPGETPLFGVSCGGPLNAAAGVILSPPNLPGWDAVNITGMLTERFGGSAYLMNDANAGTLAEWGFGAGKGCRSVVFLTHGTGMGAGLVLDGRLHEGATGDAGEIGHVRLAADGPMGYNKAGSFEGFCSGNGIAQLAARMMGNPSLTARDVALAAADGDAKALEVLRLSGQRLGEGLAILIDVLNPDAIILGSIYSRAGRFLEPAMREVLEREALAGPLKACRILPAALGENIGNVAAVSVALYRSGRFPAG